LPTRLVCRNEVKISGKSESNSTSRRGAETFVETWSLMKKIDNQTARSAVESAYILRNHRQEALAAVVVHDGHHVLGAIPESSADPAKELAIRLKDLAADDVLHVELSFPNGYKSCTR
jgi:hypothetical protein